MWSGRNLPRCWRNIPSSFSPFFLGCSGPQWPACSVLSLPCDPVFSNGVQPSLSICISWHTSWVPSLSHFPLASMQNCVLFCCPCTVPCLFQCSLLFTYHIPHPSLGCNGQISSSMITYHWVAQGAVSLFLSLHLFLFFPSAAYLSTVNTQATSNTSV